MVVEVRWWWSGGDGEKQYIHAVTKHILHAFSLTNQCCDWTTTHLKVIDVCRLYIQKVTHDNRTGIT